MADQFPAQVAAAWIGNSMSVAMKHYRQVTEDHFKQAAQGLTRKTCRRCAGDATAASQHGGGGCKTLSDERRNVPPSIVFFRNS